MSATIIAVISLAVSTLGLLAGWVWHCIRDAREFGRLQGRVESLERRPEVQR